MSKRANPAVIGGFILGGIALGIVAIGALASGAFFASETSFVSYFSEPVNGLSVGAPVKYRGIQLGQVNRIGLHERERGGNDLAEIVFSLEHQRLINLGGRKENITDENMAMLVNEGLHSRLEVESIVTGVVFLTLEFKTDAGPPRLRNPESKFIEVPTGLSPMSELTASAGEVIARLSKIDVSQLSENLVSLTATLDQKLNQLDVRELSENLTVVSGRMAELVSDLAIPGILTEVDTAITEFRHTNVLLSELLIDLKPSAARTDSIARGLNTAIQAMGEMAENSAQMMDADAEFRLSLEAAMTETAQTMKSLRRLTDMLERNPRAIIAGKSEDRK